MDLNALLAIHYANNALIMQHKQGALLALIIQAKI